ncbi:hypothetical protein CEXT_190541 [Caerostris extrusa]|uniref:Secreted protein n=1 Tax=Caerostris extrusa TaxID=172846 RepID=A0AAV4MGG0_CAEEX|nr:hypothetical protein CEXT_190541 [Caerostris extrusa]
MDRRLHLMVWEGVALRVELGLVLTRGRGGGRPAENTISGVPMSCYPVEQNWGRTFGDKLPTGDKFPSLIGRLQPRTPLRYRLLG